MRGVPPCLALLLVVGRGSQYPISPLHADTASRVRVAVGWDGPETPAGVDDQLAPAELVEVATSTHGSGGRKANRKTELDGAASDARLIEKILDNGTIVTSPIRIYVPAQTLPAAANGPIVNGHPRGIVRVNATEDPLVVIPAMSPTEAIFNNLGKILRNVSNVPRMQHIHKVKVSQATQWRRFWNSDGAAILAIVAGVVILLLVDQFFCAEMIPAMLQPILWVSIGAGTVAFVMTGIGVDVGSLWLQGYMYEWIFQIDDLFVFHLIFKRFGVPEACIRKALVTSLCFQLGTRFLFYCGLAHVILGIHAFHYVAGAILLYSGFATLCRGGHAGEHDDGHADEHDKGTRDKDKEDDSPAQFVKRWSAGRVLEDWEQGGTAFFVYMDGKLKCTLMVPVVFCMVMTDLLFGADCAIAKIQLIPSVEINLTSSVLAMLGIRSCYSLIAHMADSFAFIHFGIGLILVFIGLEMLTMDWVGLSTGTSLGVVGFILVTAIVASVLHQAHRKKPEAEAQLKS